MKLIFSDLDGTLLTTNKQILPENILALKHWIEGRYRHEKDRVLRKMRSDKTK
ncbi:HAD family hydrolase [Lactobacillus gigeriorum]|uniref:Uncharacterized protein n=1 Tax=Lactobacillus gigeriorum DSM 23908 = CRBIP 24.85 TaxID=1423751 RepID=I7JZU8_9LACO|nr:hypothetical protein FC38_GL001771 [Lactobacillus gigeriorum DSM 23908 = CRBIP 24.85]CCI86465.1 Protein of unknown function [Lactobacillus gigeriorum DSM 23908 = CRBIP 24.85]